MKKPVGGHPTGRYVKSLLSSLEPERSGELQTAHVAAGCDPGDLSNVGSVHIGVWRTQVGVVEHVARICSQRERKSLGQLERLEHREILLDEMRTIERSDGVVTERVAARPQERSRVALLVRAPGEKLGAISRCSRVGISGSKVRPVVRTDVRPRVGAEGANIGTEREATVVGDDAAQFASAARLMFEPHLRPLPIGTS